jgi:hypothetical protein
MKESCLMKPYVEMRLVYPRLVRGRHMFGLRVLIDSIVLSPTNLMSFKT